MARLKPGVMLKPGVRLKKTVKTPSVPATKSARRFAKKTMNRRMA